MFGCWETPHSDRELLCGSNAASQESSPPAAVSSKHRVTLCFMLVYMATNSSRPPYTINTRWPLLTGLVQPPPFHFKTHLIDLSSLLVAGIWAVVLPTFGRLLCGPQAPHNKLLATLGCPIESDSRCVGACPCADCHLFSACFCVNTTVISLITSSQTYCWRELRCESNLYSLSMSDTI